ncbi:MAG TPA: hypothetical protein DCM02_00745 [Flavobacterium sp.]|nr:hypothetical protein [Flavobacterium sp.]
MKNIDLKIKKMSLANIEGKLTSAEMDNIMAGSGELCKALYVTEAAWIVGAWANFWNPIGWGSGVTLLALNGYCAFKK